MNSKLTEGFIDMVTLTQGITKVKGVIKEFKKQQNNEGNIPPAIIDDLKKLLKVLVRMSNKLQRVN